MIKLLINKKNNLIHLPGNAILKSQFGNHQCKLHNRRNNQSTEAAMNTPGICRSNKLKIFYFNFSSQHQFN